MEIAVVELIPKCKLVHTEEMTDKQLEYISVIENYKFEHKKTPTIRTICKLVGVSSPSTAFKMLELLKTKGYDYEQL